MFKLLFVVRWVVCVEKSSLQSLGFPVKRNIGVEEDVSSPGVIVCRCKSGG